MDFTLSKQQAMVQKMYKEFAENEVKPLAKKVDAEEYFPKETVEKMAKLLLSMRTALQTRRLSTCPSCAAANGWVLSA